MNTPVPRIDISALKREAELGSGGQGKVAAVSGVLINDRWPAAMKTYSPAMIGAVNADVLADVIGFPQRLSTGQSEWLYENTAWPAMMVDDSGTACGFLMRRVPPGFYFNYRTQSQGVRLIQADLAFLLNPDSYVSNAGICVADRDRIALLAWLAHALSRLHSLEVVVGDLSPKNLLFRLKPSPSCFIIDCDAMQVRGQSVLPDQIHTPDWEVPAGEPALTAASDAYKLGLLAIRLFARDQSSRDPAALGVISQPLAALASQSLSGDPGQRPGPGEWLAPLRTAALSASAVPPRSIPLGTAADSASRISVFIPSVAGANEPPPAAPRTGTGITGVRPTVKGLAISTAIAAVIAVIALTAVAVNLAHHPATRSSVAGPLPTARSSAAPSPPAGRGGSSQAAQMDNVLSMSAASRGDLQAAVNNVGSCSDAPSAVSAIKRVAGQRRAELAQALALSTDQLPRGSALKSDLVQALRYSLQADEDFLRWGRTAIDAGCSAPAPLTRAYREGVSKSKLAEAAKTAFIRIWNPIAVRYSLPTRSQNAI